MLDDVDSSILTITIPFTRDAFGGDHDNFLRCQAPSQGILISLASSLAILRGILILLAHFSVAVRGT